jgi:hypothetical protein
VTEQEQKERDIRITVFDERGAETHLALPQSVVRAILGPEFIELPIPEQMQGTILYNFFNVGRIRNVWIHDSLD